MSEFVFRPLSIAGSYLIESFHNEDIRGTFVKNYEQAVFKENGIEFSCNECFVSTSSKNVIRGMHFQLRNPQAKLVGVLNGKVYDVLVDLRRESDTFGKWEGFYLSSENRASLLIPRGCAHGFISLSDNSMVSYLCDGKYDKQTDTGIYAFDPEINVKWPIENPSLALLGERDKKLMSFSVFRNEHSFITEAEKA